MDVSEYVSMWLRNEREWENEWNKKTEWYELINQGGKDWGGRKSMRRGWESISAWEREKER